MNGHLSHITKLTNPCLRLKRRTSLFALNILRLFFLFFFSICLLAGYHQRKEWGFCGSDCLPIPHGHTFSSNTAQILVQRKYPSSRGLRLYSFSSTDTRSCFKFCLQSNPSLCIVHWFSLRNLFAGKLD